MPDVLETLYDVDASTGSVVESGTAFVDYDWADLIWGVVTVGRRSRFDVFRFGFASWMEVVWRAALVRANLVSRVKNRFAIFDHSRAFWALDGSEKVR